MRQVNETALGCIVAACYAVAFAWGRLSPRIQRLLIGLFAIGGIGFCVVALFTKGDRAVEIRSLLYRHHYVVDHVSAPSNLLPLLVGAALLAVAAAFLFAPSRSSEPRSLLFVIAISSLMTLLRFGIDKAAVSETIAHAFGILWMAPALGFNAAHLESSSSRRGWLVKAAYLSRIPAIFMTVVATHFDLGTHYSLVAIQRIELPLLDGRYLCSPLDATQWLLAIAVPQLVLWPLLTVLVAMAAARIATATR